MKKFCIFVLFTVIPAFNTFAGDDASFSSVIKERLEYCVKLLPDDGKERELNINVLITKNKKLADASASVEYKNPEDIAKAKAEFEKTKSIEDVAEKGFMECIMN